MKKSILFLVIILPLAVGVVACNNNADAVADDTIFEGHFLVGFELSSFVPCGSGQNPGYGKGYWLDLSPDTDFAERWFAMISGDLPDDYLETGMYIRFVGELSPSRSASNGYGHLGAYKNQVIVTQLLDMSFEDKCPN